MFNCLIVFGIEESAMCICYGSSIKIDKKKQNEIEHEPYA